MASIVPMRVDFAGGWLDVPSLAKSGSFIVNCAVTPGIDYPYQHGAGLGGSAADMISRGVEPFMPELSKAGWQDPAVIIETGLCAWRSGPTPELHIKANPDFLRGRMALWWTGKRHWTSAIVTKKRPYNSISIAGDTAMIGVQNLCIQWLKVAVSLSYAAQLEEGMDVLPEVRGATHKYLGAGWGGYALYLFDNPRDRESFTQRHDTIAIEPYLKKTCLPYPS